MTYEERMSAIRAENIRRAEAAAAKSSVAKMARDALIAEGHKLDLCKDELDEISYLTGIDRERLERIYPGR